MNACTAGHVVTAAAERAQLAQRFNADVVDMEGTALAAPLRARGRPLRDGARRQRRPARAICPPLRDAVDAQGRVRSLAVALAFARAPRARVRLRARRARGAGRSSRERRARSRLAERASAGERAAFPRAAAAAPRGGARSRSSSRCRARRERQRNAAAHGVMPVEPQRRRVRERHHAPAERAGQREVGAAAARRRRTSRRPGRSTAASCRRPCRPAAPASTAAACTPCARPSTRSRQRGVGPNAARARREAEPQAAAAAFDRRRERAVVDQLASDPLDAADRVERAVGEQHAAAGRGRGRAAVVVDPRERVQHAEEKDEGGDQQPLPAGDTQCSATICETSARSSATRGRDEPRERIGVVLDVGVGEPPVRGRGAARARRGDALRRAPTPCRSSRRAAAAPATTRARLAGSVLARSSRARRRRCRRRCGRRPA